MNFSLNITLKEYLEYHWERTIKARRVVGMSKAEFEIIWTKNYYQERYELLESHINAVIDKLKEIQDDIHKNGKVVEDWGKKFLKSNRSNEAYVILRDFTKLIEGMNNETKD